MSFFTEFFNNTVIAESKKEINCHVIFGKSVKLICNYKIDVLSRDEIILKVNKERIRIGGDNLSVVSMAKGEIDVSGNVSGVERL